MRIILVLLIFNLNFSLKAQSENFKTEMLTEVNNIRSTGCKCGDVYMKPVPPVVWNNKLQIAAKRHVVDMHENDFSSHTGSDRSRMSQRVTDTNFDWNSVGENIHMGSEFVKDAVLSWKNSPGHCKNMMSKDYKFIGAAKKGELWVQVFGSTFY